MKIEYETAPEDWASFGEYHARTSAKFRHATRMNTIAGIILLLLSGTMAWRATHSVTWFALGVGASAFWAWYWPRQVVLNVRSYMAGKDRPCLRGLHVMEALSVGLHSSCDVTDATVAWVGVRNVIDTPEHVFVMLDELQGYVIPKCRVLSGDIALFTQEVERLRTG